MSGEIYEAFLEGLIAGKINYETSKLDVFPIAQIN